MGNTFGFVYLHSFNFQASEKSTGSSERPLKRPLTRLRPKQTVKCFNFNEGEYTNFDLFVDSICTHAYNSYLLYDLCNHIANEAFTFEPENSEER